MVRTITHDYLRKYFRATQEKRTTYSDQNVIAEENSGQISAQVSASSLRKEHRSTLISDLCIIVVVVCIRSSLLHVSSRPISSDTYRQAGYVEELPVSVNTFRLYAYFVTPSTELPSTGEFFYP